MGNDMFKNKTSDKAFSLNYHLILIISLCALLMIPQLFFNSLLDQRQYFLDDARSNISSSWGESLIISPPLLSLELYSIESSTEKNAKFFDNAILIPSDFKADVQLNASTRTKGFYSAKIYTATVNYSGYFDLSKITPFDENLAASTNFDLDVLTAKNIYVNKFFKFEVDGKDYVENINSGGRAFYLETLGVKLDRGYQSIFDSMLNQKIPFNISFEIRGSSDIILYAIAKTNTIMVQATGVTPKFTGDNLPSQYSIQDNSFNAVYNISNFSNTSKFILADHYDFATKSIIDISELFNQYSLIERLTKYAFFFILVTFACIFIVESICNIYLTAVHFLVVGSALVLFYLVILSLSEHMLFAYAYIIASLLMILMISLYLKTIFKNKKIAVFMGLVLTSMYTVLFAIIHAQNYALLVGTLILVVLLGAIMYVTAKLKTYSINADKTDDINKTSVTDNSNKS